MSPLKDTQERVGDMDWELIEETEIEDLGGFWNLGNR